MIIFQKKNRAMSLIDMIIAIAIFAMGMQVFTLVFIKVWNNNSFIVEEGEASMIASRMVDETVRNIRKVRQPDNGAFPVVSGDEYNFTAFLDIDDDGTTEKVHYFLENEVFKVGITKPDSSVPPVYASGDAEVKNLAQPVINVFLGEPVFSYYNKNYPGDLSNNPLPIPLNPSLVRLVKVHLFVNIKPNKAPDHTSIESVAELRNLNDYNEF